jgi:hypothetical protein
MYNGYNEDLLLMVGTIICWAGAGVNLERKEDGKSFV